MNFVIFHSEQKKPKGNQIHEFWYILIASCRMASMRSRLMRNTNLRPEISRTELLQRRDRWPRVI